MIIFLFFVLPVLEIVVFILSGIYFGWLWTVAMMLFTTCLGMSLSRYHRLRAENLLMQSLAGQLPDDSILDSTLIYVGTVLLILPGFITDAAGLILLIPWGRALGRFCVRRFLRVPRRGGDDARHVFFRSFFAAGPENESADERNMSPLFGDGNRPIQPDSPSDGDDGEVIDVDFEVKK